MTHWWESETAAKWWFSMEPLDEQVGGALLLGIETGIGKNDKPTRREDPEWGDWRNKNENPTNRAPRLLYGYDKGRIRSRYRSRIATFLRLLDCPVDDPDKRTSFETALQSTNWLIQEKPSPTTTTAKDIADGTPALLLVLKILRPRLILLLGTSLYHVMTQPEVLKQFSEVFGKFKNPELVSSGPVGIRGKSCSFGYVEFDNLLVLAFPHPTGSRIADAQVTGMPEGMLAIFKKALSPDGPWARRADKN